MNILVFVPQGHRRGEVGEYFKATNFGANIYSLVEKETNYEYDIYKLEEIEIPSGATYMHSYFLSTMQPLGKSYCITLQQPKVKKWKWKVDSVSGGSGFTSVIKYTTVTAKHHTEEEMKNGGHTCGPNNWHKIPESEIEVD